MRTLFIGAAALTLAACAGSSPALAPDWLAAEAGASLSEPERALLARVVRAAEAHDWDAFVATLAPYEYAQQVDFLLANDSPSPEAARAQILVESFCCPVPPFVEGGSYSRAGVDGMRAGLDRIDRLLIRSATGEPGLDEGDIRTVGATVVLDDGSRHHVDLRMIGLPGGDVALVVAAG